MSDQGTRGAAPGTVMLEHLAGVERHAAPVLDALAPVLLDRVLEGGLVHTTGAGHSLEAMLETFYRPGGLACVHPLYDRSLLPLHGAAASTAAERTPGLGTRIVEVADPGPHDLVVVFSNSGVNPYPVEVAQAFRRRRLPVVAVTSRAASLAATPRAGARLVDVSDHILDTLVPPGDVAYPPAAPRTASLSSLVNTFVWNMLLASVHDLATGRGAELPLWRSSNAPGGDEWNAGLLASYGATVKALSAPASGDGPADAR